MARPPRIAFEGALYHVTFRGNERRDVFRDDGDRRRFVDALAESVGRYRVRLHLACLMPNHVHLLLGTPEANLSAFMGRLLTAYCVYFNRRHRRVGHLTQGRYKAQVVEGDSYLLKLSRYIHLNPVSGARWKDVPASERIEHLRGYRWSTYRGYAGWERPWAGVDMAPVLALVASKDRRQATAYREFVEGGIAEPDIEFGGTYRRSRLSVGSDEFGLTVLRHHRAAAERASWTEDMLFRRRSRRHPPEEIMEVVAGVLGVKTGEFLRRRRNSPLRAALAWALHRFGGLTQREVAARLGLGTGAAVSQQIRRWEMALAGNPDIRGWARGIERRLS